MMFVPSDKITATLELLCATWPRIFSRYEKRRRPLAIGIHRDIVAVLDIDEEVLRATLRAYTSNTVYQRRLQAGTKRRGLDGKPAGSVAVEDARPDKLKVKKKPKRDADLKAQRLQSSITALKAAALRRKRQSDGRAA